MKTRGLISATALVIAMGFASPVAAQVDQLTIGGVPVPADQLDAVQTRCNELFAANQAVGLAQPDSGMPAADPLTPGASADNLAADANAAPAAAMPDPNAPIDIAAITVELCEEGGFTDSAVPAD